MARVKVRHACGHDGTAWDRGTKASADYLAEMTQQECSSCLRQALFQAAVDMARELALPDLEGSDKQVPWAITLRDGLRQGLGAVLEGAQVRNDPELPYLMAGVNGLLYGVTDAGYWIDKGKLPDPQSLASEWARIARAVLA